MSKAHWLEIRNINQPWADEVPNQRIINTFNKAIELKMSCRTHNEFGIQFPRQRLPNLPTRQGINQHDDLWNTMKSRIMINEESHCFVSSDFL